MRKKRKKVQSERKSFTLQADADLIAEFDELSREIYGSGGKRTQRIIALIRADVAANRKAQEASSQMSV